MNSTLQVLTERVQDAMIKIDAGGDPLVRASQDDKFGDYQSNCAMGLAKALGKKPREIASAIIENLLIDDICETPEIAGPGFVNLRLKPGFIAGCLQTIPLASDTKGDRLGIAVCPKPETVVVDLSSPNLAKEMHVGHLRSTVIGDCICRILEFQGHKVHRENHVGDWGTQFGMLVAYLRRTKPDVIDQPESLEIKDLESFYVEAKALFDKDDAFKTESRETVVALQQGDVATRRIWKAFCDESLRHCHAIYDRLNVRLEDRGESAYTKLMEEVVDRLEQIQQEQESKDKPKDWYVADSDGALCLFMDGFKARDGEPLPLIVRKSDGGFNYATSDLATIVHRVETLNATRIIYVVGIPQKQHFDMVFAAVRKLDWAKENVILRHLGFGSMLASSGKPFKTRDGGTVKLKDLLDEAVERARNVAVNTKSETADNPTNQENDEVDRIAETIGLGAIKYFDLSHSMSSDYKFDLNIMLSLEGNTAPYLQYAYARIRSIGRKAGVDWSSWPTDTNITLEHATEIALATKLLQFPETLDTITTELRPNILTDYLFTLAKTFSRFYDKKLGVRVIDASPEELKMSRLRLCDLTARTLKLGLHLLGIETLEQM